MTVILGYIDKDKRYIASDTQCSNFYSKQLITDSKIFKFKGFFAGISGDIKILNSLETWKPPTRKSNQDIEKYVKHILVPSLMSHFEKERILGVDKGILEPMNATIMFVLDSGIYIIQSDFSCYEVLDNFHAIGCGEMFGRGALNLYHNFRKKFNNIQKLDVDLVLREIIQIISSHDPGVGIISHVFEEEKK